MSGKARVALSGALTWLGLIVLLAATVHWLPLRDPLALDLAFTTAPPSLEHLAGTDELGRDVFSRLLHAAGSTILIVAGATSLSLLLAVLLGTIAGFVGGWFDVAVRISVDLLWSVPFVVFVVLIVSVVGVSQFSLIVTIGVLNWVGPARVVRSEVARLRDADFVVAARAHGYSPILILLREVLPNLRRSLVTLAAYGAIEVLTLETGLAFVGLSLPAPTPTWGGMLADGLGYFSTAWWVVIGTSAAITTTLGALQIVARSIERAS
jgi:peptide/nickel transport system permease protein